jgi:hypothetical protein
VKSNWFLREKKALEESLNRMPWFCGDCGSLAGKLILIPSKHQFRFIVHHEKTCPVLRNSRLRRACDDMLCDTLRAVGPRYFMADYCDGTFGEHEPA